MISAEEERNDLVTSNVPSVKTKLDEDAFTRLTSSATLRADRLEDNKFRFTLLDTEKAFPSVYKKDVQDLFSKWGLDSKHMYFQKFNYDPYLPAYQVNSFLNQFFQDPNVTASLKVVSKDDTWNPLGVLSPEDFVSIKLNKSATHLSFFDRLTEGNNIIRSNGSIVKCFDEYYSSMSEDVCEQGDFTISDELRKVLLDPGSDYYDVFSESDRNEFIFHIFKHLVLGGNICQYEDRWEEYLDLTKTLYKGMVSAQKNSKSRELFIQSDIFKIIPSKSSWEHAKLFPLPHTQNFLYFAIDYVKRRVCVWYHASPSYFQ